MKENKTNENEIYTFENFRNENFYISDRDINLDKLKSYIFSSEASEFYDDVMYYLINSQVHEFNEVRKVEILQDCIIELAKNVNNYKLFVDDISVQIAHDYPQYLDLLDLEGKIDFSNDITEYLKLAYKDYFTNVLIKCMMSDGCSAMNFRPTLIYKASKYKVPHALFELIYHLGDKIELQMQLLNILHSLYKENKNTQYGKSYCNNVFSGWLDNLDELQYHNENENCRKTFRECVKRVRNSI